MNTNDLAKKGLEWVAIGTTGFYIGLIYVATLAYSGQYLPAPDWYQQVLSYELPIIGVIVLSTVLWIGLDYFEYRLTE